MSTIVDPQQAETLLRLKIRNGKLYRSDEKLANWLGIPAADVPPAVTQLVTAGVLTFVGMSRNGSEIFRLPLSGEARQLHRVLVENASVSGVVTAAPTVQRLAELAGVTVTDVRLSWDELQHHGFVAEQRVGNRLLPVVKVWEVPAASRP